MEDTVTTAFWLLHSFWTEVTAEDNLAALVCAALFLAGKVHSHFDPLKYMSLLQSTQIQCSTVHTGTI